MREDSNRQIAVEQDLLPKSDLAIDREAILIMKKIQVIVSGKVQGVGFRKYTQNKAEQLGVVGFVQNLSDGTVKIVAAGEDDRVDALINWAKSGSPPAKVDNLEIETMEYQSGEFDRFEIRRFYPQ